jgi:hypothetical protein
METPNQSLPHIDWEPVSNESFGFRSHALNRGTSTRLSYRPTVLSIILCLGLVGLGVAIFVQSFFVGPDEPGTALLVGGIVVSLFGLMMSFSAFAPRNFDKGQGRCTVGWSETVDIERIAAVQIIQKWQKNRESRSYFVFELNLVLDDGSRKNLVCHKNAEAIRAEAKRLADFLGVPTFEPEG